MNLLRQPVLHFVLLGVALFVIDAARADAEPEDPTRTIVVTDAVRSELRAAYEVELLRPPTDEELDALVERWTVEEALLREAQALGLDENDPIIRRRLVQSMRFVLESANLPAEPDEADIDAWIQENLPDPAERARVSVRQVFISAANHADPAAEAARLRAEIEAGADPNALGDPFIRGRTFENVSSTGLERIFGEQPTADILAQPVQEWGAPFEGPLGYHIVWVESRDTPPENGTPEERATARRALQHAETAATEAASIQAVVDEYTIVDQAAEAAE